ncbi:MAG: hypothetical protein PWR32_7 [Candidatus Woesearchaeota archaeon]|nr:hypothetical protein [Candidatus Woesearchaeota archaeon]
MPVEVKTEIDNIVDIVKKKKEISIDELSKQTNINRDILEEILHFLEEQGYLKLEYKLTNTFVKAVENSGAKVKLQKPAEDDNFEYHFASLSSDEIEKPASKIRIVLEKLLFLDLSVELFQWKKLFVLTKKVLSLITASINYFDPITVERLNEVMAQVLSALDSAKRSLIDKNVSSYFERIKELYLLLGQVYRILDEKHLNFLSTPVSKVLQVVKKYVLFNSKKEEIFSLLYATLDALRKQDLNVAEENSKKIIQLLNEQNFYDLSELNQEQKLGLSKALSIVSSVSTDLKSLKEYFKNFVSLIEQVIKNITLDEIDLNSEVEKELSESQEDTNTKDVEELKKVKDAFFKQVNEVLNNPDSSQNFSKQVFSKNQKETSQEQTEKKITEPKSVLKEQGSSEDLENLKKVQVLLVKTKRFFEEKNLQEALKTISLAKASLAKISNRFYLLKKIELGKEIYSLESKLIENFVAENKERINNLFSQISEKIKQLDIYIKQKDFKSFTELYSKLKELVSQIPEQFSIEKNHLQIMLLKELVQAQVLRYQNIDEQFSKVKSEFFKLRNLFEAAEHKKDTLRMMLIYSKMQKLILSLEDSQFKYTLLTDLDRLYLRLLDLIEKERLEKYDKFRSLVDILLQKTNEEIDKKRFDSAREYYHKALLLIKKSPPGFFEENAKLRQKVMETYQKLVSEMEKIKQSLAPTTES